MEFTLNINLNRKTEKDKAHESINKTRGSQESEKPTPSPAVIAGKSILTYEVGKMAVEKVSSSIISTYGARHADEARQNQINNTIKVAGKLTALTATIATGNWPAAIGLLATEVISIATNLDNYNRLTEERTLTAARSSERIGVVKYKRNRGN